MPRRPATLCLLVEILLVGLLASSPEVVAAEICPGRFPVLDGDLDARLPFCSSAPLHVADLAIERIVVSLPSSNYDGRMALDNVLSALARRPELARGTLVVAPQFLHRDEAEPRHTAAGSNVLLWRTRPFWGSSKATVGGGPVRTSAYRVLDTLLAYLTRPEHFRNLRRVVVVGHSAGGQMVQRFAASSGFEPKRPGLEIRYVVLNPSSYLYFDADRPVVASSERFAPLPELSRDACPGWNDYGYGLEALYAVQREAGLDAEAMRRRYASRRVVVLVGGDDSRRGDGLSTHCAAELQGRHRLERGQLFWTHLQRHFGPSIETRHRFAVVPGVGHSGRHMLRSPLGLRALFD
ncbi:MAG: hypothetical protein AAGC60_26310 [Acidobacteriota bacterium]